MQKTAFQTKEVEYPPILYTCGIWLKKDDGLNFYCPLTTNRKKVEAAKLAQAFYKNMRLEGSPNPFTIKLSFLKDVPLSKDLWLSNEELNPEIIGRMDFLLLATQKPNDFNILVTPAWKEERLLISTTTAIRKDAGAHETKAVMKQTDLYVSPEAKNAALYSIEEIIEVKI